MKFVFIRHSKTDRNPAVPIVRWGLTDDGIELAKKLSGTEAIRRIDVLYTSLQTKALETAVLLAKPNAIPIKTNDDLTEVSSFTGPFESNFEIYTKNVHDFYHDAIQRIAGGESKTEALKRFNVALELIGQTENNQKYVGIVSHGNILALFAAQYKDVDCYALHTTIKQPDVAIFDWETKQFQTFYGE